MTARSFVPSQAPLQYARSEPGRIDTTPKSRQTPNPKNSVPTEPGNPSTEVVRPPEQRNGLPRTGESTKGYSGFDQPPKGTHTAPISRLASVSAHPEISQHLVRPA